jgi:hypothetical protein
VSSLASKECCIGFFTACYFFGRFESSLNGLIQQSCCWWFHHNSFFSTMTNGCSTFCNVVKLMSLFCIVDFFVKTWNIFTQV